MAFDIEQFFQSIDVILTQRLNDLSYDKTIIATIVDDSNKEKGHYIVSDGTIKFDAYSNDLNYKIDDQVRVTILNGDWSQKKFIAGKYSDKQNNSIPVSYVPPLSTTMQDSQSSLSSITNRSLTTNGSIKLQAVWSKRLTEDDKYYTLQANGIYNTITLSADFSTSFDAIAGNYGLLLELYISPSKNSNERIRKFVTFDSSEMLGNPYSYVIDSRQQKQILIASEGIVTEIILYIYQAQNFDVKNGQMIQIDNPFLDRNNQLLPQYNIIFKNMAVGFGSDLTQIEDNALKIYSIDTATYHYNNGVGDESNNKSIGLVWYNKSEDNEYIGFSDGIIKVINNDIQDYDEIDYLLEKHSDVRLMKYKGKAGIPTDEVSLQHAADIADSEPYLIKTYQLLTGKNGSSAALVKYLQSISAAIAGTTLESSVQQLISSYTTSSGVLKSAKLVEYANIAEIAVQRLINKYNYILRYGYEIQNQYANHILSWSDCWTPKTPTSSLVSTSTKTYLQTFNTQINKAITDVESFLTAFDQRTQPNQTLAGYRGVYDAYVPKVRQAIQEINLQRSQIIITTSSEASLSQYQTWDYTHYEPYAEKDLSDYHNKYCIYWYRYNPKYKLNYIEPISEDEYNNNTELNTNYSSYQNYCLHLNKEYLFGQFLGPSWERVLVDKDNNYIHNIGLPTTIGNTKLIKENGITQTIYYFPPSPEDTPFLNRKMDPKTEEERYQAVLFYNHEQVNSNVLTFINTEADKIPAEFAVDASDKLVISHGADSQEHYQSYTSSFDLVNIADESKHRSLRVSYEGLFSGDEALAGAGIYWYVPLNSTMLTFDKQHLVNNLGFTTDENGPTDYSKNGYRYFYKYIDYNENEKDAVDINGNLIYNADGTVVKDKVIEIEESDRYFNYKIKPYYEQSAQNNTIIVEAHIHGENDEIRIVTGEIFFTFSTFGSNGTKYTFVITPASTQIATLPNKDLQLNLSLKDAEGSLIALDKASRSNPSIEVVPSEDNLNTYNLAIGWHAGRKNLGVTTALTNITDVENSEIKNISVQKGAIDTTSKYIGILKAKVSYVTTGKNPDEYRTITLSTLYSVPYSSNENYFISGPTSIVYNNQGILSRLSEDPFKLYSRYSEGVNNVEVPGQKWYLKYYDNTGNEVTNNDIIVNYMPSLNSDGTLTPAPMYYSYENNNTSSLFYIPVAVCTISDVNGNEDIAWTQPIIITQNQYASPTLNDWNGEFKIDEANGTILSTMLGAGKKTINNTFEGVLMGDIVAGGDFDKYNTSSLGNASGIGLYGFNDGAQSFYFGIDGTAFLGKSTSGRINFDGNNGFIYSQKWLNSFEKNENGTYKVNPFVIKNNIKTLSPGKDGLAIDLQNGHIDAYDFKVTSKNIYLNSNPDDAKNGINDYYFRIGNNGKIAVNSYEDLNGSTPKLTKGYMAMTKEGDLEIRANTLSLTGQIGGVNLLRQTSPQRTLPLVKVIKTVTTSNAIPGETTTTTYSYAKTPLTDTYGNALYDWDVTKRTSYNNYKTYCLSKGYQSITYDNIDDFRADSRTKHILNNGSYTSTTSYQENQIYYVWDMEPILEADWNSVAACAWGCVNDVYLAGSYRNETFAEANKHCNKDFYLAVTGKDNTARRVTQTVSDIKPNEYYTLSGYVSSLKNLEGSRFLNITFDKSIEIPNWSQVNTNIEFNNRTWTRFEITFKITTSSATSFTVAFESTNGESSDAIDFALWHLKLESGSIASTWSPAPDDIQDTIQSEQDQINTYLSQDVIFDKLVTDKNGEKMVGIWLLPGEDSASGHNELYINASYMATGILRSSNWDGILQKVSTSKRDKYNRLIYTYQIAKAPSRGLYLNLDQGKMWAANFELTAYNSSNGSFDTANGLYLNSSPGIGGRWLYLGNTNNHIEFKKTSSTSSTLSLIMAGNFTLTAGTKDTENYLALYSSDQSSSTKIYDKTQSTWRIIAGKQFGVDKAGNVYASSVDLSGKIIALEGKIGDWILDSGALKSSDGGIILASKAVTIGNETIAKNTIQGGTIKGSVFTGGTVHGSKILGGTLDIGGTLKYDSSAGSGNFSVDSNGNVHIGTKSGSHYPFEVSNTGNVWATSATIGGWQVTDTSISNGGIALNSGTDDTPGIYSTNWKSLSTGATQFNNLIVANSFFVLNADNKVNINTKTIPIPTKLNTVFGVTSEGNVNFTGTITLGPKQLVGLTTDKDTGAAPANGDGYVTIKVDTPWEDGTAYMTFYNGILCGYHYEKGTAQNFFEWLLGDDRSEKGIGSDTRPVYVAKGGKVTPIKRDTSGKLYMGRGLLNDPNFIDVTGYSDSSNPNRFGLTYSGHGDSATHNKFYVTVSNFTKGTASAAGKPGLVPAPAKEDNTKKFLRGNGDWCTIYVPTSLGSSNQVWASRGSDSTPAWRNMGSILNSDANNVNAGKFLKANNTNYISWAKINLVPDVPGTEGPWVLGTTNDGKYFYWWKSNAHTHSGYASSSHTHSEYASSSHTHSGYASSSHTHSGYQTKNGNTMELSQTSTSTTYPVVCNVASPNTLYRYSSTIGTVASSRRYKHNIHNLLDGSILYKLQPVSFQYNDFINENIRYGFIAEDVLLQAPELVEKDKDDNTLCNAIYPDSILALAVVEIQKLRKELDELKSNLNREKGVINNYENND